MYFIAILLITTLTIASSAAFFSIYGLANIFEGAFWPVVVMASSLEAGKLVAASYVYRYWTSIQLWMKAYLISAILILMLITSAGIFGYLSSAYQQDTLPLKEMISQISLLKEEKLELSARKKEMDIQVAQMPANFVTGRQRLLKSFKPELDRINARLPMLTTEIRELTNKKINQEVHTGPITFIAKAMGNEIDDATKWMIFLIIFAFDPLAVILTIGTNIAIVKRKEELEDEQQKPSTVSTVPAATSIVETAQDSSTQNEFITHATGIMDEMATQAEYMKDENNKLRAAATVVAEPSPKINTEDQLREILNDMNLKTELSPAEIIEKDAIEELLAKKAVKRRIRNPNMPVD